MLLSLLGACGPSDREIRRDAESNAQIRAWSELQEWAAAAPDTTNPNHFCHAMIRGAQAPASFNGGCALYFSLYGDTAHAVSGQATVLYADGARLEGRWVRGVMVSGTVTWPNGNRYEGTLAALDSEGRLVVSGLERRRTGTTETFTGRGRLTAANGASWEGNWTNASLNGTGVYVSPQLRYEGGFRNGSFFGPGTAHFPDGSRFEGTGVDGRVVGPGILVRADGQRSAGRYTPARFEPSPLPAAPVGASGETQRANGLLASSFLADGYDKQQAGDHQAAVELFRRGMELDPGWLRANPGTLQAASVDIANSYAALGSRDLAVMYYRLAATVEPAGSAAQAAAAAAQRIAAPN